VHCRLTNDQEQELQGRLASRVGNDTPSETLHLTAQSPSGAILLSRTIADFMSDRAASAKTFLYRRQLIRVAKADDPGPWREATSSEASVFFA
jgi:hypothetical protein